MHLPFATGHHGDNGDGFEQRMEQPLTVPHPHDDCIPVDYVGAITHARRKRGDRLYRIGDTVLREGDWLSLDGNDGRVFAGRLEVVRERPESSLRRIEAWRHGGAAS